MKWSAFLSPNAAKKAAARAIERGKAHRATFGVRRYVDPDDRSVNQGICVRLFDKRGAFVRCL